MGEEECPTAATTSQQRSIQANHQTETQHRHANMNIRKTRGIAIKQKQVPEPPPLILTLWKTNAAPRPILILSRKQTKPPPSLKLQSMHRISGGNQKKTRTFPFRDNISNKSTFLFYPRPTSLIMARKECPRSVVVGWVRDPLLQTNIMVNNLKP